MLNIVIPVLRCDFKKNMATAFIPNHKYFPDEKLKKKKKE